VIALAAIVLALPLALVRAAPPEASVGQPALIVTPKPTAPIAIDYRLTGTPRVGETLALELTVTAAGVLVDTVLELDARQDLTLVEPTGAVTLGSVSADAPASIVVQVLAYTAGTHYLQVTVTGDIDGQRQSRSLVVPVRIADDTLRKPAGGAAGNQLETVRSFRAIETLE
jgi:hypothetical protein